MIGGRNKLFRSSDPAPFTAHPATRVFSGRGPSIRETEVIVAARDPIGICERYRVGLGRALACPSCLWPDNTVNDYVESHFAQQSLQNPDCLRTGIDVHVKNRGLDHLGQQSQERKLKIMPDENVDGLCFAEPSHIRSVHHSITGQIQTQTPHGMNGHTIVCCAARIIRVIYEPALSPHDLSRNLPNRLHRTLRL
jgi:hypothetical protein